MVYVQSQGYTDSYGKLSKNIIDLAGQSDYKMSQNPDTHEFDVSIVVGDFEKYLYSAPNEEQCSKIFQNMLKYHGANEATTMVDVNAFMIPEVESNSSLEDIEDMMEEVLEFFGYYGLVEARRVKINELVDADDLESDEVEIELPQSTLPLQHTDQLQPDQVTCNAMHNIHTNKYIHYT